jgi:hypothetical protein
MVGRVGLNTDLALYQFEFCQHSRALRLDKLATGRNYSRAIIAFRTVKPAPAIQR